MIGQVCQDSGRGRKSGVAVGVNVSVGWLVSPSVGIVGEGSVVLVGVGVGGTVETTGAVAASGEAVSFEVQPTEKMISRMMAMVKDFRLICILISPNSKEFSESGDSQGG